MFWALVKKEEAVPCDSCSTHHMSGDMGGGAIINLIFKAPPKCRCTHLSGSWRYNWLCKQRAWGLLIISSEMCAANTEVAMSCWHSSKYCLPCWQGERERRPCKKWMQSFQIHRALNFEDQKFCCYKWFVACLLLLLLSF